MVHCSSSFPIPKNELKDFLDSKVYLYNNPNFIDTDPIQVPHRFQKKEDIEISAFLVASIAWGNRKTIINNANKMMSIMDNSPHDFIMNFTKLDTKKMKNFVHRTFNNIDFEYFIKALKNLYTNHGGIEPIFCKYQQNKQLQTAIHHFKEYFFELKHLKRTEKHISDPINNSAAKRINLFLKWMIRKDTQGVDFGIWDSLSPAYLSCPLDIHSGNVARALGLLSRKQNDAKAVTELDQILRILDPKDPVKYDYALFGLGVFENKLLT